MIPVNCRVELAQMDIVYQLLILLTITYPSLKDDLGTLKIPKICVVFQSFSKIEGYVDPKGPDSDDEEEKKVSFEEFVYEFYNLLAKRINQDLYTNQYDFSVDKPEFNKYV